MALKGTLKDFGIADILQLIAQQQKTGMLVLKAQDAEVSLGFKDGNIVKVESAFKKKKDLLGTLLVRAELITEQQLEQALEMQKRTLQRIGDVLVTSRDIEPISPLRAESVLMEGFRMVDEWPLIRKRITSYEMTFERLKQMPPRSGGEGDPLGPDDPFAGEFESLGREERTIFELVAASRDVRKIIDLSCLGEFEACKALCKLVNLEYLRAIPASGRGKVHDLGSTVPASLVARASRIMVTAGVLAGLAFLAPRLNIHATTLMGASTAQYVDPAAQRIISASQIRRIQAALELYRLERGPLPDQLNALVEVGLLAQEDLHFPWREGYYYRKLQTGDFILLPPLR
jgi:hypothetical protein